MRITEDIEKYHRNAKKKKKKNTKNQEEMPWKGK